MRFQSYPRRASSQGKLTVRHCGILSIARERAYEPRPSLRRLNWNPLLNDAIQVAPGMPLEVSILVVLESAPQQHEAESRVRASIRVSILVVLGSAPQL